MAVLRDIRRIVNAKRAPKIKQEWRKYSPDQMRSIFQRYFANNRLVYPTREGWKSISNDDIYQFMNTHVLAFDGHRILASADDSSTDVATVVLDPQEIQSLLANPTNVVAPCDLSQVVPHSP